MADVARGSVLLTPKFDGLTASITRQLGGAFKSADGIAAKAGASASASMGAGFLKSGALIGAASALTSKAFDAISASMGSAITRVDTMANFPKVMQNLGYSSEDAQRSIARMSEAIDGMPTSLDSITGMVQQLAPLTSGMDEATSIGIAFNNALLAGGASAFDVSRAMQQYTQMLSKGKPELQDWKTLQEVMPGQLNQIAQALLGPTAKSMDLYGALKEGSLTMDDFNAAMVRLSSEGVNGFASFEEQARTATGGIGTAITNVQNRISKGVANIIDAIGQTNISGAINALSSQIGPASMVVANGIDAIQGYVSDLVSNLQRLNEAGGQFSTAFKTVSLVAGSVRAAFTQVVGSIAQFTGISDALSGVQASASDVAFWVNSLAARFNALVESAGGVDAIAGRVREVGVAVRDNVVAIVQQAADRFSWLASAAGTALDGIDGALSGMDLSSIAGIASKVAGAVAAFYAFNAVKGPVSAAVGALGKLPAAFNAVKGPVLAAVGVLGNLPAAFAMVKRAVLPFRASIAMVGPIQTFRNALSFLPGALSAISIPAGIVVGAIAALAAGFAYFYTTSEPFRASIDGIIASLGASLVPIIQQLSATVTAFAATAMPVVMQIAATVAPVIQQLLVVIAQIAAVVIQVAAQVLAAVLPVAAAVVSAILPVISTISGILMPIISAVLSVVSAVLPPIGALFSSVFGAISSVVTTVMNIVGTIVSAVMGTINAVISGDLGSIQGIWSGAWETMRALLGNVWEGIKSGVSDGIAAVMDFVGTIPDRIMGFFAGAGSWLMDAGASIINGLKDGIMNAAGGIIDTVSGVVGKIRAFFPFSPAKTGPFSGHGYTTWSGRALITDFGESVRRYAPAAASMVEDAVGSVREAATVPEIGFAAAAEARTYEAQQPAAQGGASPVDVLLAILEELRLFRESIGDIIEDRTPVEGERSFGRRVRAVVAGV